MGFPEETGPRRFDAGGRPVSLEIAESPVIPAVRRRPCGTIRRRQRSDQPLVLTARA